MADIELSVPYKHAVTREGRLLAWTLWPAWALMAPLTFICTLLAICIYPAVFVPALTASLLIGSALVFLFGGIFTLIAQDDTLHVSKDGIYLPRILAARFGLSKFIPWDRLTSADVVDSQQLRLVFKGARPIDLSLQDVSPAQVEQLLLAIELWGDKCERTPHLVAFQLETQNAIKGIERVSYTQMWEQELAARFTPTTFVPLEPGTQIQSGRLKVVRQLSFGGFSAIYLVRDEAGKFFVAKEAVLPPISDEQTKAKAKQHFEREARILSSLAHPGIARVYDAFSENGRDYILLEQIDGQNLRQKVNQSGPLPVPMVRKVALELAAVLDYLHAQAPPVVHRDLSPDNVMIAEDGRLVLIDFGAANHFIEEAMGTVVGKQAYMPPEQLRGQASALSDYYSFGATLFFLLTGKDPIALSPSHPRLLNSDVPEQFDELIAQLTAFEEAERSCGASSLTELLGRSSALCPTK